MFKNALVSAKTRIAPLMASALISAAALTLPMAASAQTSSAAPNNPAANCTWNWNHWIIPNGYTRDAPDNYNPTRFVFSKSATSAGANTWYDSATAPTTANLARADNQFPTESGSGTDSERFYGVGYFVNEPGTNITVTFNDTGRNDGHVFAVFDSSDNLIARFPTVANVGNGRFYYAGPPGHPVDSELIDVGTSWTRNFSWTVPADGQFYLHYIAVDENNRITFATNNACKEAELNTGKSASIVGGLQPDGSADVQYSVDVQNTGELSLQNVLLEDDLTAGLGSAFNGIVANPMVSGASAAGSSLPTVNPDFDGGVSDADLFASPAQLAIGDSLTVTFTVNVDPTASGAPASLANLAVANADDPAGNTGTDASDTDTQPDGSPDTAPNNPNEGTGVPTIITLPAANPALEVTKTADDDELVTVGQIITYTYTARNTGDVNIRDVTINDVHNGAGPAPVPGDETLPTDAGTTGDSTDAATNGSWDLLAPGDTVTFTGTYTVQQADIDNLQ